MDSRLPKAALDLLSFGDTDFGDTAFGDICNGDNPTISLPYPDYDPEFIQEYISRTLHSVESYFPSVDCEDACFDDILEPFSPAETV